MAKNSLAYPLMLVLAGCGGEGGDAKSAEAEAAAPDAAPDQAELADDAALANAAAESEAADMEAYGGNVAAPGSTAGNTQ